MIRSVLFASLILAGCSLQKASPTKFETQYATDFNFTLTSENLNQLKRDPHSYAQILLRKLNGNGISRVIFTSDAFASHLKEDEITRRNSSIIDVSDLNPKVFAAACAINMKDFYWQELRNCRLRNVYTYVFNFTASRINLDHPEQQKKFIEVLNELNQYRATILIRGTIGISNPQTLAASIEKTSKLNVVFSDYRFLSRHSYFLKLSNVYLELSELQSPIAFNFKFEIHRLLRKHPAGKFLYGSGMTLDSSGPDPGWFLNLGLPDSVAENSKRASAEQFNFLFSREVPKPEK